MPSNRTPLAVLGVGTLLAVALGLPAAAGAATKTPTPTSAAGTVTTAGVKTTAPKTLLAASLATARKQPSVHFVATSIVGKRSIKITADAGTTAGSQVIVLHEGKTTGHMTGVYVNNMVYFRGDTIGLEDYLGMPTTLAPKYKGKWISFASSTQDFSSIAKSMTLTAAVGQISVNPPVANGGKATLSGHQALGIVGNTSTLSSKGNKGKATLYVSATGSPLPIRYLGSGKQKKQKETGQVRFSNWGEKVSPTVPASAVPASTIKTTGASTGS